MKYAFKIFWINKSGALEPLFDRPPPPLEFPSVETVREKARELVMYRDIPAHSLVIESEDGTFSERWFWINGEWRSKPN
jgi:hypothetical protein